MSDSVDEKVVRIKFDNEKFEQKVKNTMQSLKNLKESLNFEGAAKGLENFERVANSFKLSHIEDSLNVIEKRFSTLGIIGASVINNLTTAAMGALSNAGNAIENMISGGGLNRAQNIEKAKFQLNGLGIAWETVSDDIDFAVNKTAYGLDAAALAASTLAASGVAIGDAFKTITDPRDGAEKQISHMAVSLKAISGVAAQTQSEYSDIANIFSTVAGQGRLMTMQLRQLEMRGMNAAAVIAEHMGISEAEVREGLAKGLVDYETFAEAMYDKFADHASDANNTLNGVLANIRAAFAKIGQSFYTPLIENEGPLVKFLDKIRGYVNDLKKDIEPKDNEPTLIGSLVSMAKDLIAIADDLFSKLDHSTLGSWLNSLHEPIDQIHEKVMDMYDSIWGVEKKTKVTATEWSNISKLLGADSDKLRDSFIQMARDNGIAIDEMIASTGSFENSLNSGWLSVDAFEQKINELASGVSDTATSQEDLNKVLEEYSTVVHDVWMGKYGDDDVRRKNLQDLGYEAELIQSLVDKGIDYQLTLDDIASVTANLSGENAATSESLDSLSKALNDNSEAIDKNLRKSTSELSIAEKFQYTFYNIHAIASWVKSAIEEAWDEMFGGEKDSKNVLDSIATTLYRISDIIKNDIVSHTVELTNTFKGLFAAVDIIRIVFVDIINLVRMTFAKVTGDANMSILDLTGGIGELIVQFHDWLESSPFIADAIDKISSAIAFVITKINDLLGLTPKIKDSTNKVSIFSKAWEKLKTVVTVVAGGLAAIVMSLVLAVKDLVEAFKEMDGFSFENVTKAFDNFKKKLTSDINGKINVEFGLADKLDELNGKMHEKYYAITQGAGEFKTRITDIFANIFGSFDMDSIMDGAGTLVTVWSFTRMVKALKSINPVETFNNVLGAVAKTVTEYGRMLKSKEVMFIAIGVGILCASLALLIHTIKDVPLSDLATAVGIIAGLAITLTACFIALQKLSDSSAMFTASKGKGVTGSISGIGLTMFGLAASLLMIALAIKQLKDVGFGDAIKYMIVILAAAAGMLVMVKLLGVESAATIPSLGTILGFAAGLYITVLVLKKLGEMDWETVKDGLVRMIPIFAALEMIIWSINKGNINGKTTNQAASAFKGIALMFLAITASIYILGRMNNEVLQKGLGIVTILLLMIAGLGAVLNLTSKELEPGKVAQSKDVYTGISKLLISIAGTVFLLGNMNSTRMWQGVGAIGIILAFLAALGAFANFKLKGTALTVSMVKTMSSLIISIAVSLTLVANLCRDPARLWSAVAAIGIILFALAALSGGLAKVNLKGFAKANVLKNAIMAIGMLVVVAGALWALSTFTNPENLIASCIAIGVVFAEVIAAILVLSGISSIAPQAGMGIALSLILLAGVALILGALVHFTSVDECKTIVEMLAVLFASLIVTLVVLTGVGAAAGPAIVGILVMDALLVDILGMLALIGAIAHDSEAVDKGLEVLQKVAGGIGKAISMFLEAAASSLPAIGDYISQFISNIEPAISQLSEMKDANVGSALSGISDIIGTLMTFKIGSLPTEEELKSLAERLGQVSYMIILMYAMFKNAGFTTFGLAKKMFKNVAEAMGSLNEMISQITGNGDGDVWKLGARDILNYSKEDMTTLAERLGQLGYMLILIYNEFSNAGFKNFGLAKTLFPNIADAMKGLNTLVAQLTGNGDGNMFKEGVAALRQYTEEDLSLVAERLGQLSYMLILTYNEFSNAGFKNFGLAKTLFKNIATAMKDLGEFVSEVTGGVFKTGLADLASIDGKTLADAATKLGALGFMLIVFYRMFNAAGFVDFGMAQKLFPNVSAAMDGLADMSAHAQMVPWESLAALPIEGFQKAGTNMAALGLILVAYWNIFGEAGFKTFSEAKKMFANTADAFDSYVVLCQKLLDNSSILAGVADTIKTESIAAVGNTLTTYAQTMVNVGLIAKDIDNGAFDYLAGATDKWTKLFNDLPDEGARKSLLDVADTIKEYSTKVAAIDFDSSNTAMLESFAGALDAVSDKIKKAADKANETMKSFANGLVSIFKENTNKPFKEATNAFLNQIAGTISTNKTITSNLTSLSTRMVSSFNQNGKLSNQANSSGRYFADGIAQGVENNSHRAVNAARNLGIDMKKAYNNAVKIKSPSREMRKSGGFFVEGIIKGVYDKYSEALGAVRDLGRDSINIFTNAMAAISSILPEDLDMAPTITPVVDMSNVRASAGLIKDTFGTVGFGLDQYAIDNIDSINIGVSALQNKGNSEVVNAIDKLRSEISNLNSNTYNVDGITYDDGSNISDAVQTLVSAARVERRA